jgi:hypothetical protein
LPYLRYFRFFSMPFFLTFFFFKKE